MENNITGKQKVLGIVAHVGYFITGGASFCLLAALIYLYFKDTDQFIAYSARQAAIVQAMFIILSLPMFVIVLCAGDGPEAFADSLGLFAGIMICLYVLFLLFSFLFILVGSIYVSARNAAGKQARYLPVMLYDKVVHDDAWYFPGKQQKKGE